MKCIPLDKAIKMLKSYGINVDSITLREMESDFRSAAIDAVPVSRLEERLKERLAEAEKSHNTELAAQVDELTNLIRESSPEQEERKD